MLTPVGSPFLSSSKPDSFSSTTMVGLLVVAILPQSCRLSARVSNNRSNNRESRYYARPAEGHRAMRCVRQGQCSSELLIFSLFQQVDYLLVLSTYSGTLTYERILCMRLYLYAAGNPSFARRAGVRNSSMHAGRES